MKFTPQLGHILFGRILCIQRFDDDREPVAKTYGLIDRPQTRSMDGGANLVACYRQHWADPMRQAIAFQSPNTRWNLSVKASLASSRNGMPCPHKTCLNGNLRRRAKSSAFGSLTCIQTGPRFAGW